MDGEQLIKKAYKLLNNQRVQEPYFIQISIHKKKVCEFLDNLGCDKKVDGTTVIYDVEKALVNI